MSIIKGFHKVSKMAAKNSPAILTGVGVAGLGATAYYSYKSAKKIEVITDDLENRRKLEELIDLVQITYIDKGLPLTKEVKESYDVAKENFVPIDRFTVVKDVAGAVALPVALGLASITCIVLSYHIQNNRIVTLAGALATATAERIYYNNKFKADYGQEEYEKFTTPVERTRSQITDADGEIQNVDTFAKVDIKSLHGVWFSDSSEYTRDDHEYNMAFVRQAAEALDLKLFRNGFLTMNEVLDALSIERTKQGALMGWSVSTNFTITPEITICRDKLSGVSGPQIYIKWSNPTYIYDLVEYKD